ncbi:hypothetical protein ACFE04_003316 [Oxalis oulophora]
MGKVGNFQQHETSTTRGCFNLLSIRGFLSFKCVVVLILSFTLLLSGVFWILPNLSHSYSIYAFDAKPSIKQTATIQASFKLPNPVLQLVPLIKRLEYGIFSEIGVPDTKVTILSMHQPRASSLTDVVFGVLPDPINVQTNPVSMTILKSSFVELFIHHWNLTLTTSIFGQPTKFEILKFPGGITVIPMHSASIWELRPILFNFTLNNSISDIQQNFVQLKNQLKYGLRLNSYENVYVQLTNKAGSTISPPVTVQASITSDRGNLLLPRLKQLAQTITNSHPVNLGLNNSVFGEVKSISLSSYLKSTLHANPPSPSPSPTPSPEPSLPTYPNFPPAHPPRSSPARPPYSQAPSPLPEEPGQNIGYAEGPVFLSLNSMLEPPPFASAAIDFQNGAWLLRVGVLVIHLLYWLR